MSSPLAAKHTYYLPAIGRALGDQAGDPIVERTLREEWERRSEKAVPALQNGVATWIDTASGNRRGCCVVRLPDTEEGKAQWRIESVDLTRLGGA